MQEPQGDNSAILQGIILALVQISQWMDRLENSPGWHGEDASGGEGTSATAAAQDMGMSSDSDGEAEVGTSSK